MLVGYILYIFNNLNFSETVTVQLQLLLVLELQISLDRIALTIKLRSVSCYIQSEITCETYFKHLNFFYQSRILGQNLFNRNRAI